MFDTVLSALIYALQIIVILIFASIVPALVFIKWKRKKLFAILLLLCLSVELFSLHYLAHNPLWICPKEYKGYISGEEKQTILGYNTGIYSNKVPIIPVCILVRYADEDAVKVTTFYFAFGYREFGIGSDGLFNGDLL